MGSLNPSPELTLDFRPSFIPKTIAQFLEEMSRISNLTNKLLQVDDFVTRLETEMRKIEAFEGELPLCMLLINDAIDALKEESMMLKKSSEPELVLEEFIPMKTNCNDDSNVEIISKEKENGDKKNWLSSTQLWNTHDNLDDYQKKVSLEKTINNKEEDVSKQSFSCDGIKNQMRGNDLFSSGPPPQQQTTTRKQRRCWSTELHRRFVGALQELGGSQAATPKQIRELMQVDGLTNDEVKSHLQKYRLHTRRIPSSNTNQIVEGGLWMPLQDQYVGSHKCSNSKSGSPDGPLPNGGNNMDDEEDEKSENYCWNGNLQQVLE